MKSAALVILSIVASMGGGLFIAEQSGQISLNPPQDTSSGKAAIGGSFTLTDQNGNQVSDRQFRGKTMLVFFGFTSCPSICPVGLATLTQVMEQLGNDGKRVQPVFITVDPETDTPARMKEFLTNFHPAILGLTGTPEQINAVQSAYKVYATKVESKDMPGGYNVDHSGFIYLLDKQGEYSAHFQYQDAAPDIANAIRRMPK